MAMMTARRRPRPALARRTQRLAASPRVAARLRRGAVATREKAGEKARAAEKAKGRRRKGAWRQVRQGCRAWRLSWPRARRSRLVWRRLVWRRAAGRPSFAVSRAAQLPCAFLQAPLVIVSITNGAPPAVLMPSGGGILGAVVPPSWTGTAALKRGSATASRWVSP
eukprot:1976050-Prymnesium_polylepis.1